MEWFLFIFNTQLHWHWSEWHGNWNHWHWNVFSLYLTALKLLSWQLDTWNHLCLDALKCFLFMLCCIEIPGIGMFLFILGNWKFLVHWNYWHLNVFIYTWLHWNYWHGNRDYLYLAALKLLALEWFDLYLQAASKLAAWQ